MKSRVVLQFAGVVLSSIIGSVSLAAVDLAELESDCVLELGGEFLGASCEVTTIIETPYSQMVRPSGKSGLGWTAVGVTVETTVDVYAIEESTEEVATLFVAGDMSLPGCRASKGQPQKCFDHYETATETVFSWVLESSDTTTAVIVTGCLNPGGRNMGLHKQCAN